MTEESVETRIVREGPMPLRMIKRRTRKEDGRYLIYYDFVEGEEAPKAVKPEAKP